MCYSLPRMVSLVDGVHARFEATRPDLGGRVSRVGDGSPRRVPAALLATAALLAAGPSITARARHALRGAGEAAQAMLCGGAFRALVSALEAAPLSEPALRASYACYFHRCAAGAATVAASFHTQLIRACAFVKS